jgi:ABC-type bacteriocin/lantibiotic exporter with double-glycine peptidase domain
MPQRCVAVVLAGLVLGGCAPLRHRPGLMPEDARLLPVPGLVQEEDRCGSNSLAMVLAYLGRPVPEPQIAGAIFQTKLRGTLNLDLALYARSHGFETRFYQGNVEDLLAQIDSGQAPILMLRLGTPSFPPWRRRYDHHFVVVYGYSRGGGKVYLHSGFGPREVSLKELEKLWQPAHRWTLLIQAPPAEPSEAAAATS